MPTGRQHLGHHCHAHLPHAFVDFQVRMLSVSMSTARRCFSEIRPQKQMLHVSCALVVQMGCVCEQLSVQGLLSWGTAAAGRPDSGQAAVCSSYLKHPLSHPATRTEWQLGRQLCTFGHLMAHLPLDPAVNLVLLGHGSSQHGAAAARAEANAPGQHPTCCSASTGMQLPGMAERTLTRHRDRSWAAVLSGPSHPIPAPLGFGRVLLSFCILLPS